MFTRTRFEAEGKQDTFFDIGKEHAHGHNSTFKIDTMKIIDFLFYSISRFFLDWEQDVFIKYEGWERGGIILSSCLAQNALSFLFLVSLSFNAFYVGWGAIIVVLTLAVILMFAFFTERRFKLAEQQYKDKVTRIKNIIVVAYIILSFISFFVIACIYY